MALGGKTSTKFFVTSGGGGDEINSTRKTNLEAIVASEASEGSKNLINDPTLGPVILNIQKMQDDLDELRRFVASSAEIKGTIGTLDTANGGTGISSNFYPIRYITVTATTANMNNLHNENPITQNQSGLQLVPAPGAGLWINPISIVAKIDRAANQTNGRADLSIGFDKGGKKLDLRTHFIRRFGFGAGSDSIWQAGVIPSQVGTVAAYENLKLVADGTLGQAFTTNCFTSVKFHVGYQILPI